MMTIDQLSDDQVVIRTCYGEARGEGHDGWIAVFWVIRNRARHPSWWGHSIREVCLKGTPGGQHQFDCWDENDPNRAKLLALPDSDPVLTEMAAIWDGVKSGDIVDPTHGATYYHTKAVQTKYDASRVQTAEINHHVFFKDA